MSFAFPHTAFLNSWSHHIQHFPFLYLHLFAVLAFVSVFVTRFCTYSTALQVYNNITFRQYVHTHHSLTSYLLTLKPNTFFGNLKYFFTFIVFDYDSVPQFCYLPAVVQVNVTCVNINNVNGFPSQ